MTVIISTDGTNLYDLKDMQEAIQDDISDYHLDEIMEEVCKENNIPKYYISENYDTGKLILLESIILKLENGSRLKNLNERLKSILICK